MIVLQKNPNKDFIVLNLTDPQLSDAEWEENAPQRKILEYTIEQLIARVQPDLITISGDLAWAGCDHAYRMLATFLEKFSIPWAPVWGNHDNQAGAEYIDKIATEYLTFPHCIYEKGDPRLGNGNYVICVEENGNPVEAIFMIDSHDRDDFDGEEKKVYSKLTIEQMDWYKEQTCLLKEKGYTESMMVLHIPIYAYNTASKAAYKENIELAKITVAQADGTECWKEGYEESFGVQHEGICSYPNDDGVFAMIKEEDFTQYIIAGHDHVNNWVIRYDGVTMVYGLKAGAGCYWDSSLNGGTVFKINSKGVYEVSHVYVDPSPVQE